MRTATLLSSVLLLSLAACSDPQPPVAPRAQDQRPTIALIGATSRTGKEIIRQALAAGYR